MIEELGTPVHGVNWVRLHAGKGARGEDRVLVTMGQQAEHLFVLSVDAATGAFTQHFAGVDKANYPTATLMASSGLLYIGSSYAGHLLRYDPGADRLDDLGEIHPGAATFPCRMDEDPRGRIWIGSYPTADLTSYDPVDGSFTRHGRMDETDMYCYPFVDRDGLVACRIGMTRPHVKVFDPERGTRVVAGPMTVKGEDTFDFGRGEDGVLYVRSSRGDCRVEAGRAMPISRAPEPLVERTEVGGGEARFADADALLFRELEIRGAGGIVRHRLDYSAAGSDLFVLHEGPDRAVYGSSILPEHLFRYRPQDGDLEDLGRCSESGGEAYSMGSMAGKLYIASYPAARLSVYDPGRPVRYGLDDGGNPRDLGRMDEVSFRPRAMLAGPLGRVWTASLPDYGMWGGPLSWYDPATGGRGVLNLAGEASCYALAWVEHEGWIAVGTNIAGGTGTQPKAAHAELILLDPADERVVWRGVPGRDVAAVNSLAVGPDRLIYGTARALPGGEEGLFRFDVRTRAFEWRSVPGEALDLGLRPGKDGELLGFTRSTIYRVEKDPFSTRVEADVSDGLTVAGPVRDGCAYFGTGHRLRRTRIA